VSGSSSGPAARAAISPGWSEARRPRVFVVDDQPLNRKLLAELLGAAGCEVLAFDSGEAALAAADTAPPDLALLDVLMPGLDGIEVCRRWRARPPLAAVPVVMVTSLDATEDRVRGLEAGADDFLSKPILRAELYARVRSLLRVRMLFDEVWRQRAALADWGATLEARVAAQVEELARMARLKRFFSPALASRLLAAPHEAEALLASHRGEVSVLFCDLRGFSAFAETAGAARVMSVLAAFHAAMGGLVFEHGGTLERFTGDGMMVFFNDPDPQPDHAERAVRLALAMQRAGAGLASDWQAHGGPAGLACGIALGVATLGAVGFEARLDYAAIGHVTNLAARLCAEAAGGEVLICPAVNAALAASPFGRQPLPPLALHGLAAPVAAWRVVG
jgi:DNA-binding response OmpR family regulator